MSYAPFIKEIGRGPKGSKPLSVQQAESLFGDMMDGRVPDLELGAIILSMRIKAESTDELLGFQRALDARCARLAVPAGPRLVVLPTYNGARRQPNLMPLVAQLLARHHTTDASALHQRLAGHIWLADNQPIELSASRLRALLDAGQDTRYLLPESVAHYIDQQGLYRANRR